MIPALSQGPKEFRHSLPKSAYLASRSRENWGEPAWLSWCSRLSATPTSKTPAGPCKSHLPAGAEYWNLLRWVHPRLVQIRLWLTHLDSTKLHPNFPGEPNPDRPTLRPKAGIS